MAQANQAPREEAVTPLIGTVLMLGITAVAIAMILAFGTPVLQRLQDQAALQSMAGQMQDIHAAALNIGSQDAQRTLPIRLPAGSLDIVDGGRFMVTVDQDSGFANCDFHVTGWQDPAATTLVVAYPPVTCHPLDPSNCNIPTLPPIVSGLVPSTGGACFAPYKVVGASLVLQPVTFTGATAQIPGGTAAGDWLFRMTDGATIYAEAWLLHTDNLAWTNPTSASDNRLELAGGALFATSQGNVFLPAAPSLRDGSPAAPGDVYLKFVAIASDGSGLNDRNEHSVSLAATGTYLRDATAQAFRMRYDLDGPTETAWCQSLDERTAGAAGYRVDPALPCLDATAPTTNVVRGVVYELDPSPGAGDAFAVTFLHATLQASIHV